MKKSEFDMFADEYSATHQSVLGASGEEPEFFHAYKIADIHREIGSSAVVESVVDFGAGVGNSVPHVNRLFPGASLTCLDVSSRSLEIAEHRFPGMANYLTFDGNALPLAESSVDLVYAACVFHHIDAMHHTNLMKEVLRILKPGGSFFVFEHNPLNPLTVRAVNTCEFDENAVLVGANQMRRKFIESGYSDIYSKYRIFFPKIFSKLRFIEPYIAWLPLGAQYFVSGRKKD